MDKVTLVDRPLAQKEHLSFVVAARLGFLELGQRIYLSQQEKEQQQEREKEKESQQQQLLLLAIIQICSFLC